MYFITLFKYLVSNFNYFNYILLLLLTFFSGVISEDGYASQMNVDESNSMVDQSFLQHDQQQQQQPQQQPQQQQHDQQQLQQHDMYDQHQDQQMVNQDNFQMEQTSMLQQQ